MWVDIYHWVIYIMGIEVLFELDGERIEIGDGYWVKFDAKAVNPTAKVPHGVSYSFTLHRCDNKRILGFDNAHAVKPKGNPFRYAGQVLPYDHQHPYNMKPAVPYYFNSPEKLVTDFWNAVDEALKQEGVV